jgi:ferredoxin-thioredoxin reductase catalytic chain
MDPADSSPESALKRPEPSAETLDKMARFVAKYRKKSGTVGHPDPDVTKAVVFGLAANLEETGRALCPCNFYPDKEAELREHGRRWVCACDEMKKWKYCHCLLFVTPEGMPITEYLPEDHRGRRVYGDVKDPTPEKGRESHE